MNEKVFIPAIPKVTPQIAAAPAHAPVIDASKQAQTPASPTKRVSSRTMVGVPSKTAPPHINPTRVVGAQPVKREYAWQRRRALGKRI